MTVPFNPIDKITADLGRDIAHVVHTLSAEKALNVPFLEHNLLRESNALGQSMVERTQQRMTRWRENIARLKERRHKLAQAEELNRSNKTLADKAIAQLRIASLQRKHAREAALEAKVIVIKDHEREIMRERAHIKKNERREMARSLDERYAIRLKQEHAEEVPPEVIRERFNETKENAVEKMRTRGEEKDALIIEKRDRRKAAHFTLHDHLAEKATHRSDTISDRKREDLVAAIEDTARERTLKTTALREYAAARKAAFDAAGVLLNEKGKALLAERLDEREARLEKLHSSLMLLLERFSEKKHAAQALYDELLTKSKDALAALMAQIDDPSVPKDSVLNLAYLASFRDRVEKMLGTAHELHADPTETIATILHAVRTRRELRMKNFFDEFPGSRVLADLNSYLKRKEGEILSMISRIQEQTAYRKLLAGFPPAKRRSLQRIFHQIIISAWDANYISGELSQLVFNHRDKHIGAISHFFIERVTNLRAMQSLFVRLDRRRYLSELTDPLILQDIQLLLGQENLRSLLSGLLIDQTLRADIVLRSQAAEDEKNPDRAFTVLNRSFTHNRLEHATGQQPVKEKDDSYITRLIQSLESVPLTPEKTRKNFFSTDIVVPLTVPPSAFDTLNKDINAGLHREIVDRHTVFENTPLREIEEKNEEEKSAREEVQRLDKKQALLLLHQQEYLKAIEEQNITAQERANNERNLIDLFF